MINSHVNSVAWVKSMPNVMHFVKKLNFCEFSILREVILSFFFIYFGQFTHFYLKENNFTQNLGHPCRLQRTKSYKFAH